jgi:hypothetical protein
MSMHGDYASMAEAVGEAEPSPPSWTADELAELAHDLGDEPADVRAYTDAASDSYWRDRARSAEAKLDALR